MTAKLAIAAAFALGLTACEPAFAAVDPTAPLVEEVCVGGSFPGLTDVEGLQRSMDELTAAKGITFNVVTLDDAIVVLAFVQSLERLFGEYPDADLETLTAKVVFYRQSDARGSVFIKLYDASDCFIVGVPTMPESLFYDIIREAGDVGIEPSA